MEDFAGRSFKAWRLGVWFADDDPGEQLELAGPLFPPVERAERVLLETARLLQATLDGTADHGSQLVLVALDQRDDPLGDPLPVKGLSAAAISRHLRTHRLPGRLPPLRVGIYDWNGRLLKVVNLPDPREAFCRRFDGDFNRYARPLPPRRRLDVRQAPRGDRMTPSGRF